MILVVFHGDWVPHKRRQSIQVFSWNVLHDPSFERFLFCTMGKEFMCRFGCNGRHSHDQIIAVLRWSLECLFRGSWPSNGHDGVACLPQDRERQDCHGDFGVRAISAQARRDWAWYKEVFDFPSWAIDQICWLCEANKSDKPHTDFRPSALWRRSRLSAAAFFNKQSSNDILPGPLDLGVSQHIVGNIFREAYLVR